MVIKFALILSVFFTSSLSASERMQQWATSYLLNEVFTSEYLWVAEQKKEKSLFWTSIDGLRLISRAELAYREAKKRGQSLRWHSKVEEIAKKHRKKLNPKQLLSISSYSKLEEEAKPAQLSNLRLLLETYEGKSPTCPLSFKDVSKFAVHQKNLKQKNETLNSSAVIEPIADWTLAKLQCLALTLMAASKSKKDAEGFEPIFMFRALEQLNSPHGKNMVISVLHATRLLQRQEYAETLRRLFELSEINETFSIPYNIVQRIFSIRQQGQGQVALQGL